MDKTARLRQGALLAALAATIYASLGTDIDEPAFANIATAPSTAPQPLVTAAPMAQSDNDRDEDFDGSDPFAPRNWTPPPAPEPVKTVTAAPPVVAVTVPEGPPPLPFQFMGRLNDGDDQVVYLGRGDQALVVRAGEVLESTYKVIGIGAAQIEFEHLPTKQRQTLALQSN